MSNEIYLKPLTQKPTKTKFATFDIESNGWINFEMLGFYDGRNYEVFNDVEAFLNFILRERYRSYNFYAHNGGRFDFLFLLNPLTKRNIKFKTVEQGARVVSVSFTINKRKYRFIDSFPILSTSLKKLSETFTPEHAKLSGTIDFKNERVDKNNPKHRQYLEHDCKSLYEILQKFQTLPFIDRTGLRMTAASTALAAFRTTMKKPIRRTSDDIQEFVRKSYAGGRVEIFKQAESNYNRYDVNSLFPAQMLKNLPIEYIGQTKNASTFGFHDVTIEIPDCHIPVLYTHIDHKLIFPTGIIRNTYFSEELNYAVKQGARIIKHHRGEAFSQDNTLFKEFVETLYKLRTEYPSKTPQNYIAKLLLNSCYGKFAERVEKKSLERVDPKNPDSFPKEFTLFKSEAIFEKFGLVQTSKIHRPVHALVHIGAAITSLSRLQMHDEYYSKNPESIIYTDTDSIDTRTNFKESLTLGKLKKEYEINRGYYLLPKAYYLELKNGQTVRKIKGFKNEYLDNLNYDDFKNKKAKIDEKRFATFRSSIIRNGCYLSMVDHKKNIKSDYDKRKLNPNGTTRPWVLTKNEELR